MPDQPVVLGALLYPGFEMLDLFGEAAADRVTRATEYTWHRDAARDPFHGELNVMARAMGMV